MNEEPSAALVASLAELREQGVPFVRVDDLEELAGNPRVNAEGVGRLVRFVQEHGWHGVVTVRPLGADVVVRTPMGFLEARDAKRKARTKGKLGLIAGHTRRLAAIALGLEAIPVNARALDDGATRCVAVFDNRSVELTPWATDSLAEIVSGWSAEERELVGVAGDDLGGILARQTDDSSGSGRKRRRGKLDPDELVPPAEPITRPGDLWILGRHRVLCADSTIREVATPFLRGVDDGEDEPVAMMATDPPFAIYGSSSGIAKGIADDRMVVPFFRDVFRLATSSLRWFGHAYVCCDWRSWGAIWEARRGTDIDPKNLLVWDKAGGLGSMWANCHELVGFFVKSPKIEAGISAAAHRTPTGQRTVLKQNVIRGVRPVPTRKRDGHNAAKPIELMIELIEAGCDAGDVVAEPFSGRGTTLMACERTGRTCRAIDLDPRWIDNVVRWFETETGTKARRVPANERVVRREAQSEDGGEEAAS